MNKIDIDSLSAELTRELSLTPLEKALPPKLRYRFYKWLKQHGSHGPHLAQQKVQHAVEKAYNHVEAVKELRKNEVMTSLYDNGFIRMDFGGDVDPKVKDAAMKWAKRRGLKASEASVNKSNAPHAPSYVMFSDGTAQSHGICIKYSKYSL